MTHRNFIFVINNPTDTDKLEIQILYNNDNVIRFIVQLERGTTNRTLHLQGYCELRTPRRFRWFKRQLPRAHIEVRSGSAKDAWDYCAKDTSLEEGEESFALQKGSPPSSGGPGRRSDLSVVVDVIRNGGNFTDLLECSAEQIIKYHKGIAKLIALVTPPRDRSIAKEVLVYWGVPGSGKTQKAWDDNPGIWPLPVQQSQNTWFDSYENEEVVLFDEFEGRMPLNMLLQVLDRYPVRVPYKGGFLKFNPDKIIMTGNTPWTEWYDWDGREIKKEALRRRITHVTHFSTM